MANFCSFCFFTFFTICCLIVLVNSQQIQRYWQSFPENVKNEMIQKIKIDLNMENRKMEIGVFDENNARTIFGRENYNYLYKYLHKLLIWNAAMDGNKGGNVLEVNLKKWNDETFSLEQIGILDIGNFEVKIAAEYKEMTKIDNHPYPNIYNPTGQAKCQLFKLVRNAEHFAILDDFPEGETEASSSSSSSLSNKTPKGMEQLNWIPADLMKIIAKNKQLTESRANLENAKYFNFAYMEKFISKKRFADGASAFLHFMLYTQEKGEFLVNDLGIRICKRNEWNVLTKNCGLGVHRAQFSALEIRDDMTLAKCSSRFNLQNGDKNNLHLYIILEHKNQVKEVLELKTDSFGDNILMLEKSNAKSQWKPSSSAPGTSSNAAYSILVSSLTVKHFFIEDLLIFDFDFAHDDHVTNGYEDLIIHRKKIVYCNEEMWDAKKQNCEGGNGQVEILNKYQETKSTYRLSAEQIQLSLLKEAIRIFVQIKTSARPNAVQKNLFNEISC